MFFEPFSHGTQLMFNYYNGAGYFRALFKVNIRSWDKINRWLIEQWAI